jgi:hypothetical protein
LGCSCKMGMTDWLVTPERVADFLVQQGLTPKEARELAARPDVMRVAKDKYNGKPVPQGMKDLKADLPRIRQQADKAGVSFGTYVGSTVFGKPFKGEQAFFNTEGNAAAGKAAASLPPGQKAAPPPINPIASQAFQPSSTGGLHAPKTSVAPMGPQDFGWLFNKPASGESGFHSAISRAEGTTDAKAQAAGFASGYDVPLGYGKYGTPSKPLTEMTLKEAYDFGNQIRRNPDNPHNSSALGKFQIVGSTLKDVMGAAGLSWDDTFSAENQQKLANVIAERQGVKSTTWAGFGVHPAELDKARTAWKSGDNLPGSTLQLGTPDPFNPAEGMWEGAGSVGSLTDEFSPGISATASAGMVPMSPSAQANAVMPGGLVGGGTTPSGRTPFAGGPGTAASPAPAMPSRNPMRVPQISATGQVGAMNGGLPPAPAYANAQFAPPAPPMPTRNPLRNVTAQAFGATGMPNQMPSAMGSAQFGPQASASVGAMNGGLPPAPAFGKASFGVPSALAHLVGRSPLPAAQTMSPMPSMAPRTQGFGMTNATGLASPLPSGLGMNPMAAAMMSMRALPVMPGSLMGAGTALPGATPFAGGIGSPAMPRAAAMPMPGTAAARGRPTATPGAMPARPGAPAAYGPGAAGMGAGVGPPQPMVGTINGRSAGLNNGFAPGSWGNATNSMKLQDIGASYGAGAAALSAAINRGLQGFRANRAANAGARAAGVRNIMNWSRSGQVMGVPQSAGYGYL